MGGSATSHKALGEYSTATDAIASHTLTEQSRTCLPNSPNPTHSRASSTCRNNSSLSLSALSTIFLDASHYVLTNYILHKLVFRRNCALSRTKRRSTPPSLAASVPTLGCPAWMTRSAEPRNDLASTRPSPNQRGHRDLIDVLDRRHLHDALIPAETEVRWARTGLPTQRSPSSMLQLQLVCLYELQRLLTTATNTPCVAAAAAKINAQLQARKGIQHVDVPPIQSSDAPPSRPAAISKDSSDDGPAINGEMYVADGDYIQDIEVNDLRNRYLLTKGSTQKMVNKLFDYPLILPERPFGFFAFETRTSRLLGLIARTPFVAPADLRLI